MMLGQLAAMAAGAAGSQHDVAAEPEGGKAEL